jgi:hypothetical protein
MSENPRAFPLGSSDGMSLRDWFAGQALVGGLASGLTIDGASPEHRQALAMTVYAIADAMMEARKVQP